MTEPQENQNKAKNPPQKKAKFSKKLLIVAIPIILGVLYQASIYLAENCIFQQKQKLSESTQNENYKKLFQDQEYKEYNLKLEKDFKIPQNSCKNFVFIRHAEGNHQFKRYKNVKDPGLTEKGKEQVRKREIWEKIEKISFQAVYVSPMSRTLESACGIFEEYQKKREVQFVLAPRLKQMLFNPNNAGREKEDLKEIYQDRQCFLGDLNKDIFDKLPQRWSDIQNKQLNKNFVKEGYQKQFDLFVKEVYRDFPDAQTIGIVGHSQFFKFVTPDEHKFTNTEIRTYRYCDGKMEHIE